VARKDFINSSTDHSVHGLTSRYSNKDTNIVETKSLEVEYAGDFVGTGEWTFQPTDGKTKVQYRFNCRPKRPLFVLFSPFVNIRKMHSDVIQEGFKGLSVYLSKKRALITESIGKRMSISLVFETKVESWATASHFLLVKLVRGSQHSADGIIARWKFTSNRWFLPPPLL